MARRRPAKKAAPAEPVNQVSWPDLREGDRVNHFEYGNGTVRMSGPAALHIDWDDPAERLFSHPLGMAAFLTRIQQEI